MTMAVRNSTSTPAAASLLLLGIIVSCQVNKIDSFSPSFEARRDAPPHPQQYLRRRRRYDFFEIQSKTQYNTLRNEEWLETEIRFLEINMSTSLSMSLGSGIEVSIFSFVVFVSGNEMLPTFIVQKLVQKIADVIHFAFNSFIHNRPHIKTRYLSCLLGATTTTQKI